MNFEIEKIKTKTMVIRPAISLLKEGGGPVNVTGHGSNIQNGRLLPPLQSTNCNSFPIQLF